MLARTEMKGSPAARAASAAVWGAVAATRPDDALKPLKSMLYDPADGDPHRGGARVRIPAPRRPRAHREGAQGSQPRGGARRDRVGAGALGAVSRPDRRHARARGEDGAAGRPPQPGGGARAPRREPPGCGAAAAGARDQGQRRRHAAGRHQRFLHAGQEERRGGLPLPAHRRPRRSRRGAHRRRRLSLRRRGRRSQGRGAHGRRADRGRAAGGADRGRASAGRRPRGRRGAGLSLPAEAGRRSQPRGPRRGRARLHRAGAGAARW